MSYMYTDGNLEECNRELEIFFHNWVTISIKEREQNNNTVIDIVNQIFAKVQQKDSRFLELIPVGSAFQRLKTGFPDEYDFNIVINKPSDFKRRRSDLFSDKKERFYDFQRNTEHEISAQEFRRTHGEDYTCTGKENLRRCCKITAAILTFLLVLFSLLTFFAMYGLWNVSLITMIVLSFVAIFFFFSCVIAWTVFCKHCRTPNKSMSDETLLEAGQLSADQDCIADSPQALPTPGEGEVYFRLNDVEKNQSKWNDWTYNGDLIPILVKRHLRHLLQDAASQLSPTKHFSMEFESEGSGTAVTCTLSHPELARNVSIDFSPVLQNIAPLPDPSRWDGGYFYWPRHQTIRNMKKMGVCLVPRNDFHWKISTSMLDSELMGSIKDDPHTNGCRRKSHRILKKLNEQFFCNYSKPVINSYILKNILFWECEEFNKDLDWTNAEVARRVINMTIKLFNGIQNGFIGNYSCKDINIFRIKNSVALKEVQERIKSFLWDPVQFVSTINNSNGQLILV